MVKLTVGDKLNVASLCYVGGVIKVNLEIGQSIKLIDGDYIELKRGAYGGNLSAENYNKVVRVEMGDRYCYCKFPQDRSIYDVVSEYASLVGVHHASVTIEVTRNWG